MRRKPGRAIEDKAAQSSRASPGTSDDLVRPWSRLPSSTANNDDWASFKSDAYGHIVDAIRAIDRKFANEPRARVDHLRALRREHHLLIVADRIRRTFRPPEKATGRELRQAAEFVLDRSDFIASGVGHAPPRTRLEENMLVSARVNWHKLMRRAGSHAELRGGWRQYRGILRGAAPLFRKLERPELTRKERGSILRDHIKDRIEQLVEISREAMRREDFKLTRRQHLLVRDLEGLLERARNCVRMETRSSSRAEDPADDSKSVGDG